MSVVTVSESYLLGIREGRSFYDSWIEIHGQEPTVEDIDGIIDNLTAQFGRGFNCQMNDVFRGERDFWRRKLKSAKS